MAIDNNQSVIQEITNVYDVMGVGGMSIFESIVHNWRLQSISAMGYYNIYVAFRH